jgi:ABC-type transport system involved in multi-copper enzyme maturation permease subunit
MRSRWLAVRAIAWGTIIETVRRKDVYVLVILTGLLVGGAGLLRFFGVRGLETFLKDMALTVINAFAVILAVLLAARQFPEEKRQRTLYPLLARPITRSDFVLGKFLGVWAMATLALLSFAAVASLILMWFGASPGAIFIQYIVLRVVSLGVVCAMVMLLSFLLTPSANVTISLLITIGASTFSRTAYLVHGSTTGVTQRLVEIVYWIVPHFDLFDLSRKVAYGWEPIGWGVVAGIIGYGAIYIVIFLTGGALKFARQPL